MFIYVARDKIRIRVAGRDAIDSGVRHKLKEPGVS